MLDTVSVDPNGAGAPLDEVAPSSHAQRRMWFFERLRPGSALYNIRQIEQLSGTFDESALRQALDALIRRHEALRTTFREVGGVPMQVLHAAAAVPLTVVDLTSRSPETRGREVERVMGEEVRRGFDIETGPLLRFTVIATDNHQQILVLVAHHIIFDLWSIGVFSREIAALYGALKAGRPSPLAALPIRYAEFVAAQNARFVVGGDDPQLRYWRERLRGLPASTELPPDRPRPPVQTFPGATRTFTLPAETARPFRELTRTADATLFMSLYAALAVLIHRYSGQTDLAVGTPIANRSKPGLADVIGLLLNTIVLRVDLADDPTVTELLARVREVALGAFANQDVPFELLVDDLKPARDPSRHALFQVMYVFQPGRGGAEEAEGEAASNGAKFDLSLVLTDAAPAIRGAFEYNTDLYAPATIERLARHYGHLVAAMAAHPEMRISRLPLLDDDERRHIVADWNATEAATPMGSCVHTLIEQAAAAAPHAPAVTFDGSHLTYGELDRKANGLAARLRRLGIRPGTRVGICAERSLDWAVAIVAVLKSGATMVPLDPTFPADRLAFMIEDAGIALVLTQPGPDLKLARSGARVLRLGGAAGPDEGSAEPVSEMEAAGPDDLAYVVYTSGSTGRPKGVMVEHGGVSNFMGSQAAAWNIGPGARVLQFTAFGFDIGLSEIFLALTSGACLCLARQTEMMPGPPLLQTLRDNRITHVTLPPSALAAVAPENLPDLRLVISAGEPCEPGVARRWGQMFPIVNAYGPTEATIYATVGLLDPVSGLFPIGRPIANMQVYVLDRHGAPVPPGVAGEIHIGGVGVARGYLNRDELTAERFIPDPFSERPGARLYRTGDLGRFDAAGVLHYLGRMDRQLKVRGYRIEPGEVESVLRSHPQVADAVVLGLGAGSDARLIAYVIARDPPPLVVALRGFVAGLLPDYMAPSAYVMVERWPKTANGKIDHAALPRPDALAREVDTAFVSPQSPLEQRIAAIWKDCLDIATVGVDDNFFDLGGHSLLLARVHVRLRDELKSDLSLVDLFRFTTVRLMADALGTSRAGRDHADKAVLARVDQRVAQQNAARLQRRRRIPETRNA